MPVLACSLYVHEDSTGGQEIPPGGYHLVRFPYGAVESFDGHGMHEPEQPDGAVSQSPDERSGLIWPGAEGWATLEANLQWQSGRYTQLRDRFVRDPLALAGPADSTGTDHRPPSPGMQCFTKIHCIYVQPGVPLGLMVRHDDTVPRRLVHAQFKALIHT
ncbi:hypothetical protein RM572_00325 [Streptomyces sp. DSM 42041]|uniref:Uncharacterized protein n=1 Tax=Streptomyces hazeniae TaxID=3075538 RepID=A0ABU2NJQ4_9ACTN|nr:hypothetical protein [Streptomyces sp. DSM 42041]MDT0377221.1 hypothetical protein [Streptomyces sp. DSM 42041]